MRKYEIMFIVKPDLEEKATKEVIANLTKVFTDNKCKILEKKEIGLKELAYEIKKFKKGFYYWLEVQASQEVIKEFNRLLGINENIIRYIVCNEEE